MALVGLLALSLHLLPPPLARTTRSIETALRGATRALSEPILRLGSELEPTPPEGSASSLPPASPSPPWLPHRPSRFADTAKGWPPSKADPSAVWVDGESAGPLGRTADQLFEDRFRLALAAEAQREGSTYPGFAGIIGLCQLLVAERGASGVSAASERVLVSLFPNWPPLPPRGLYPGQPDPRGRRGLLYWFEILFARPFPAFSAKLNAWVTWWAAQWLMGPCHIEGIDSDTAGADVADWKPVARPDAAAADAVARPGGGGRADGGGLLVGDGSHQQVRVQRCRFLEEARCASVCVNVCKVPTQRFFNGAMGVPMRMLPDYDTLECVQAPALARS